MFGNLIGTRCDRSEVEQERWRPQGRPVRLALVTWPVVALMGATVTTAACLLGECGLVAPTRAKETLIGHAGTVRSIEFRPDGAMLSSVGFDGSVNIWELAKRPENRFVPRGSERVLCVAFSPDNRVLAVGSQTAAVTLHDLVADRSWAIEDTIAASAGASCLAFAPDGATLAVGQPDGKISLWDTATGRIRSTLDGHSEFVPSLVFAPDGATLASSGGDHRVRIWDVPTGRERFVISDPNSILVALSFSPDGALLVVGDRANPVLRLWDMTTGVEHAALCDPSGTVVTAAISPDGTTLAAADFKGLVTFWDLATLKIRPKRLRHAGVYALAFAPDGRALATGGFDGAIHLWDFSISSGK